MVFSISRIKSFFIESKRVLRITKKPSMEEFKITLKVTGIGLLIIGLIGFLIQVTYLLIK